MVNTISPLYSLSVVNILQELNSIFPPGTVIQNSLKLTPIKSVMPSHPQSSPFPPAFNLSQHQGLFKGVSSLHQVAKVLEFQLQHQSFQ